MSDLTTTDITTGTELVYQAPSVDFTNDRDYRPAVRGTVVDVVEETTHLVSDTIEQTMVIIETEDDEERINIDNLVGETDFRVGIVDGGDEEDEGDDENEEPEMMTDGGKDTDAINAELSDDEIASAINSQGGGGDHPDAITVDEVRDALAFIAESAQEVWSTWMDNIEDGNAEVVEETADVLVVSTGSVNVVSEELDAMDYEDRLNREGEDRRVLASIITNCMHKIARNHSDRNWSVDYPWVLPAPGRDGQQYVEAVVNGLQRRGLTPGQAWAYYGVEIRGESRNSWGRRKGDHDHKNVSDALEKAKQKLP